MVWIDETNFNLFCRRNKGWSAVIVRPNSKGPNVHLIGAMSSSGMEHFQIRRGSYRWDTANEFIRELIQALSNWGLPLHNIVLVCDNAPCHARIETEVANYRGVTLLRLGPYSPMLNPIENILSKIKASVKRRNRIPNVVPPGVGVQRLEYLERIVEESYGELTPRDYAQCAQHCTLFYNAALYLEDMPVGNWIMYFLSFKIIINKSININGYLICCILSWARIMVCT